MNKEHPFSRYPGVTICESAAEAAAKAMAYRGGMVLPVHAYTQGGRMFLSTVLTVRELLSAAKINEPEKGEKRDITGKEFLNRKRDSAHVERIVTYLVENEQWILGSVILNSLKPLNTFLHGEGSVVEGYVVLPPESGTFTIDGQHREEGLKQAVLLKPELAKDSLQVIISQEQDVDQVRDDFACLGQTKPIDKSTLVTYQSSDAHVSLVKEIMEQAKIFQGRIQPEGSSVSKKNNYLLFTASSVSIAAAELLYGGSDKTTKTKGLNLLKDEDFRIHVIKEAVMFYDQYAAYSPDWTPLLQDKSITQKTVALSLLRDKRLDFRNTGFRIVSRVGYHILFDEDYELPKELRDAAIQALANVDFRLDNNQSRKFWEDCGVVTQTGVGTQRQVIEQGVKAVWDKVLQSIEYEAA
jgi:DGQHR domain-containing protein